MSRDNRLILGAVLALLCVGTAGVYLTRLDWWGPRLYPVFGKLTISGKPASRVMIVFHPLEDQPEPAMAQVDEDGNFELLYGLEGRTGALAGKYKVVLIQLEGSKMPPYTGPDAKRLPGMSASTFPPEWLDSTTSNMTVEVLKKSNHIDVPVELPNLTAEATQPAGGE